MSPREKQKLHLHFVGIGGIGMSGLAQVFFNQGYSVSGSDKNKSDTTLKLQKMGIYIYEYHGAENIQNAQVVVISSAIKKDNPEVLEAKKLRIPVIPRAEMLGELMRGKTGISVGGTHGKTTTTSMLATVLSVAGLDPTIVIGGKVDALGGNAKLGKGEYVVAEADESDGSFLHLPATLSIITNIDSDHLDYYRSLSEIDQAFIDFVSKVPFYGKVAVCAEDAGVRRCLPLFTKPIVTYGFSSEWEYSAQNIEVHENGSSFDVVFHGKNLGKIMINVVGRHNVLNALSTVIIALECGVHFKDIKKGLAEFSGVKRRFDKIWESKKLSQVLIDDYAHHPTEIRATLQAARHFWRGRILAVFQPHRYSRTLQCQDGFLSCFLDADLVWVTDIYSAGESPIEGVDSKNLVKNLITQSGLVDKVFYSGSLENTELEVMNSCKEGDLVICMGAGSITQLSQNLKIKLEKGIY